MKTAYWWGKNDRKGQAMTELAMVIPVLLLLLMGIIQFGLFLKSYIAVVNGTRLGARAAVVGKTNAQITSKVMESLSTLNADQITITITPSNEASRTAGTDVTVHVIYNEHLIVPMMNLLVPDPMPVQAQSIMRMEKPVSG
ncbi:MAG: TadE/TadG family type IV pilus assembly protein [bacterium]|nr:TadE/TadG family type IV pilus assembly protein [bacterium]